MNKPFAAYSGTESYVFVCYAHGDSSTVYEDLEQLNRDGINLWYDEGITAGASWRAEIAAAIKGAGKLLFYISESSLNSRHCLREVDYALSHDIEIVPVYLDDSDLPGELELVLNRVQALFRSTDSLYMEHLLGALRRTTELAPLRPRKRRQSNRIGVSLLAVGFGLAMVLLWSQRDAILGDGPIQSSTSASPNAFDKYLEGLELIERWDQGDNLDVAVGLFREAVTLDPRFALAFARLAEALRMQYALSGDQDRLEEAAANADEAVRLNAGLAPVQVALGQIHAARGNIDLAFAAIERAVSIDPNDAIANQALARMYDRLGRTEDAEAAFRKAVALDPENLRILDGYANFLYEQGRFEDAIRQWQTVIRLAPDHYAALVNLGSALSGSGRTAEAVTMYERAIEIRPTYMAYSNLGVANSEAQRYQEAVDAFRRALEINDSDWLAWGNLAYVYSYMNGMDPQAVETFERAIALAEAAREQNPRDTFVHSDLALYYAKTAQPELARQRVGTALSLSPESAETHAAAAEVYELIGQRDLAIEHALESIELGSPRQQLQRNPELADLLADPRMQPAP